MIGVKGFLKRNSFLKPIDLLMISYQFSIILLITIYFKGILHWFLFTCIHLVVGIAIFYFVKLTHYSDKKVIVGDAYMRTVRFFRNMYPLIIIVFFYRETTELVNLIYPERLDYIFMSFDEQIFGYQPSVEFSKVVFYRWFAEYMYFSYFCYYLIISIPPLIMYFRRDSEKFDKFIFTITLAFFFCYLFFIFCPAAGPQFTIAELKGNSPKGYVFAHIMKFIFDHFEIENGAFPSSHVVIAFVIFLFFVRYFRWVSVIIGILVAGLCVSTIYIHAHYFVDVPAGLFVGLFFYVVSPIIEKKIYKYLNRVRGEI